MSGPRTVHDIRDRRYAAWVKAGRPRIRTADGRLIRPGRLYWALFWYFDVGAPWKTGRKDRPG